MEVSNARIRVAVRIRPLLENEKTQNVRNTRLTVDQEDNEVRVAMEDAKTVKAFKFDCVLDEQTEQRDVYNRIGVDNLLNRVLDGFHATIFAYGQTGSGKTFTMEGYQYEVRERGPRPVVEHHSSDVVGLVPRVVGSLFEKIGANQKSFTISVSFLEIYNERIYDLLNPAQLVKGNAMNAGLRLRWAKKDEFAVENMFVFECKNVDEVVNYFQTGVKNRVIASHKMNMASSRSHTIFTIKVEQNLAPGNSIVSRLELVDLAGSERLNAIGAEGKLAKETIEINKSLFTLRQVISIVADMKSNPMQGGQDQVHIPYRESKLTCLLKHSIGGNSYCLMIACLAPGDNCLEENISTLTYATKASSITNAPTKNEDPKTQLINQLKARITQLTQELAKANEHIEFLSAVANERIPKYGNDYGVHAVGSVGNMSSESSPLAEPPRSPGKSVGAGHSMQGNLGGIQQINLLGEKGPPSMPMAPPPQLKRPLGNLGETLTKAVNISALENINANLQKLNTNIERTAAITDGRHSNPSFLTERLVDSVNMVRELLCSNKEMRDLVDKLSRNNEELEFEMGCLQRENEELREKVTILEGIVADENEYGPYRYEWLQKLLSGEGNKGGAPATTIGNKIDLANEIVKLKNEKKTLDARVRQLELDNMVLTNKMMPGVKSGTPSGANDPMRITTSSGNQQLMVRFTPSMVTGTPKAPHGTMGQIHSASRSNGPQRQDMFNEMLENTTNFSRKTTNVRRDAPGGGGQGGGGSTSVGMSRTMKGPAMTAGSAFNSGNGGLNDYQPTRFFVGPASRAIVSPSPHERHHHRHHYTAHTREDSLPALPDVMERKPSSGNSYLNPNRDHSFY